MLKLVFIFLTCGLLHLSALLAFHAKPVNDATIPVPAVIGRVRTGVLAYIYTLVVLGAQKYCFHSYYILTPNPRAVNGQRSGRL